MEKLKKLPIGSVFQLYSRYRDGSRRTRMTAKVITREAEATTIRNATAWTFGTEPATGQRFKHAIGGITMRIERPRQVALVEVAGRPLRVVEQGQGYTLVEDSYGLRVPLWNEISINPTRQQRRA